MNLTRFNKQSKCGVTGSYQADTSAAKAEAYQNVRYSVVTPDTSLKKQEEGEGSDPQPRGDMPAPPTHHVLMSELKDDAEENVYFRLCTFDTSLKGGGERYVITVALASTVELSKQSPVTTMRGQLRRPNNRQKSVPMK